MSLIQEGGTNNSLDLSTQPITPGAIGITNKLEGEGGGRATLKDAKLLVNDGANDRVLVGQRADGSYGIQVSKTGFDVTSGNANLVMNSDFNMFKIVATGTLTLNFTPATAFTSFSTSIAHGLGITPAFNAYITMDSGITGIPAAYNFANPYPINYNIATKFTPVGMAYVYVDSTNVYFQIDESNIGGGPYTCSARYYLFKETF